MYLAGVPRTSRGALSETGTEANPVLWNTPPPGASSAGCRDAALVRQFAEQEKRAGHFFLRHRTAVPELPGYTGKPTAKVSIQRAGPRSVLPLFPGAERRTTLHCRGWLQTERPRRRLVVISITPVANRFPALRPCREKRATVCWPPPATACASVRTYPFPPIESRVEGRRRIRYGARVRRGRDGDCPERLRERPTQPKSHQAADNSPSSFLRVSITSVAPYRSQRLSGAVRVEGVGRGQREGTSPVIIVVLLSSRSRAAGSTPLVIHKAW